MKPKELALISIVALLAAACSSAPKAGERQIQKKCNGVSASDEYVCSNPSNNKRDVKLSCDKVMNDLDEFVCSQPK
jgi:hypothetical protein